MKTYFVFGKLLESGFHVVLQLYEKAPANYYALGMTCGHNRSEAWKTLLTAKAWLPPKEYAIRRRMKI